MDLADKINFCLTFIGSNILTEVIRYGDYDSAIYSFMSFDKMKIYNKDDLYMSDEFLRVIAENN